ncbi:MAG: hypothetical protein ACLU4J_05470 [Butyricimonas paravirosa]
MLLDVPFEERHNVGRYDPKATWIIQFRNSFAYLGKLYLVTPGNSLVPVAVPDQYGITIRS